MPDCIVIRDGIRQGLAVPSSSAEEQKNRTWTFSKRDSARLHGAYLHKTVTPLTVNDICKGLCGDTFVKDRFLFHYYVYMYNDRFYTIRSERFPYGSEANLGPLFLCWLNPLSSLSTWTGNFHRIPCNYRSKSDCKALGGSELMAVDTGDVR